MIVLFSRIFVISATTITFILGQSPFYFTKGQKKYLEYKSYKSENRIRHPLIQPYSNDEIQMIFSDDSSKLSKSIRNRLLKQMDVVNKSSILQLGSNISGLYTNKISQESKFKSDVYGYYSYDKLVAEYSYSLDTDYQNDDKYFGSTGKLGSKVMGRPAISFLQYKIDYLKIFFGRMDRNYGLINTNSLIMSNNPLSFDHFSIEYINRSIKYSYITTRLEDKLAYDIRDDIINKQWSKRYFTFHRIDLSISKNLKIAFSESV